MARYSSKTVLPEIFTASNDFESFVTNLSSCHNFRSGKEKKTVIRAEPEIDKWQHYFALRLLKPAIDFYRTLLEDTRKSYDETVKLFRQNLNEKPVVFSEEAS